MSHAWWRSTRLLLLPMLSGLLGAADNQRDEHASEELACDLRRQEWQEYHAAFDAAAQATASDDESHRTAARAALAEALLERTANITDILSCNVGIIAGYYIVARLASPLAVESMGLLGASFGEAGLAYRLLQMALIFIFTLRNANRIPEGPGLAWGISEQSIIPAIMQMKKGQDAEMHRRLRHAVPISPSFRDHSLRIAVVSICAYPPDHPLALPKVTPPNREAYTRNHDYALRLHMEPPVIGAHGLGVQHAKLATVLSYLQSGAFDWVAWFDCDSIIMNMNRTLDSIIYQYTQRRSDSIGRDEQTSPICGATGDFDISGDWFDSWMPPDAQEEAVVHISRALDGTLHASAQQFGIALGHLDENEIELDFPGGGLLHGRIHMGNGNSDDAVRLEWENGAVWTQPAGTRQQLDCREPCRSLGPACEVELDPEINLLITEEGWGLSSANWLIRRSAWSIDFLHAALTAAHVEMNLFGDQDAIILHLMNRQALQAASTDVATDPMDRHAAIVPQFELNAYDALNALTMDCDAFVEGDLLITFPQCKDAEGCNDVFNLAADYAADADKPLAPDAGAWWHRAEGSPKWPQYDPRSGSALRVFGPRPVIREVFFREQQYRRGDGDGRE